MSSTEHEIDHLTSVTRMVTHEELITLIRVHSGHFTSSAAMRIAGELSDSPGKVVTCHKHGEACRIRSDSAAGFYFVTMTRADWHEHDVTVYPDVFQADDTPECDSCGSRMTWAAGVWTCGH